MACCNAPDREAKEVLAVEVYVDLVSNLASSVVSVSFCSWYHAPLVILQQPTISCMVACYMQLNQDCMTHTASFIPDAVMHSDRPVHNDGLTSPCLGLASQQLQHNAKIEGSRQEKIRHHHDGEK